MSIYLDYAASTPLKKEVLDAMLPYLTDYYGNASSTHSFGRRMNQALEKSRRLISKLIGCNKDEFYFVASGTEANNWALKGIAEKYKEKGNHIIVSAFEHPAVLNTAKHLEENGFDVTYLLPDSQGHITVESVNESLTDQTILVSIMYVNNEVGTIQPLKEIAALLREKEIIFHSDGVQALGYLDFDIKDLGVDLMSFSSHKIYGPTGVGGLYIRKGIKIKSLLDGGAQERQRRAGTSHVAGAVGFSEALKLRVENIQDTSKALKNKRDYLLDGLTKLGCHLNGDLNRHPGNMNIRFDDIPGETLLMNLDLEGIA
ncbi:cysteine desulfurase family protein, partial [Sphaerochaeta sp. S2]|uniref:cysteine desulfurase family protein n=1 Tax=Sphaerochaeta sp. S2 TaxID=2798868 RepID=UPI0018E9B05D